MRTISTAVSKIVVKRFVIFLLTFLSLLYGMNLLVGQHTTKNYIQKYFHIKPNGVVKSTNRTNENVTNEDLKQGYLFVALQSLDKNITEKELNQALSQSLNVEKSTLYERIKAEQSVMKSFFNNNIDATNVIMHKIPTTSIVVNNKALKKTYTYILDIRKNKATFIDIAYGYENGKLVNKDSHLALYNNYVYLIKNGKKHKITRITNNKIGKTPNIIFTRKKSDYTSNPMKINKKEWDFYNNSAMYVRNHPTLKPNAFKLKFVKQNG